MDSCQHPNTAVGGHRSVPGFDTTAAVALHGMACKESGDLIGGVEKAHVTF